MGRFKLHTIESAPNDALKTLEDVQVSHGRIPNLQATMAESPELLSALQQLRGLFAHTSFDALERQVVALAAAYANESEYSIAWHSMLAKMRRLPDDVLAAFRAGRPISDAKLEALRLFTSKLTRDRGRATRGDVSAFLAAGFTHRQVLEVVLAITTEAAATYTAAVAGTPTDAFMRHAGPRAQKRPRAFAARKRDGARQRFKSKRENNEKKVKV
jgi:alkylhydroperoxidase family enzyme